MRIFLHAVEGDDHAPEPRHQEEQRDACPALVVRQLEFETADAEGGERCAAEQHSENGEPSVHESTSAYTDTLCCAKCQYVC